MLEEDLERLKPVAAFLVSSKVMGVGILGREAFFRRCNQLPLSLSGGNDSGSGVSLAGTRSDMIDSGLVERSSDGLGFIGSKWITLSV